MPVSRNRSVAQDLIDLVYEKVQEISDPRSQKGRSPDITLVDIVMYALAVFHQKHSSLLSSDDKRQQPTVQSNAKSLYHVEHIPCDTYFRSVIDLIPTEQLRPLFTACFAHCQRRRWLNRLGTFRKVISLPLMLLKPLPQRT